MAFRLLKDPMDIQKEEIPISSQTVSVGEILELDAGNVNWETGDASTEHWMRKGVATEAATSSDSFVEVILVHQNQLWEADADNNSNSAHNGDRMRIGSAGLTVTNSGTDITVDTACFVQKSPVGTAADAVVNGYFPNGGGINPDA